MKTPFVVMFALSLVASTAFGATVNLKDGTKVEGNIVEQNDTLIKVDSNGVVTTHYNEDVADVDGQPLAKAAQAAPAEPAPVAQEVAPAAPTQAPAVAEPVSPEKRELILKFIDAFGTRSAMAENLNTMLETLPADDPKANEYKEKIKIDEIIEKLIPLYAKQFSDEDLKAMTEFYSSAVGKKLLGAIPVIMQESIDVSAQYLEEKFPEITENQ